MDKEGWSAPRGDVCGAKLLVCCFLRRAWDWGGLWAPLVKATARMIAKSKYRQSVGCRSRVAGVVGKDKVGSERRDACGRDCAVH